MITIANYFQQVKTLNYDSLTPTLKSQYDFTKEATDNHHSLKHYKSDEEIKEAVDEYLAALNKFLLKSAGSPKSAPGKKTVITEHEARQAAKKLIYGYVKRGDSLESIRSGQMGSYNDEFNAEIRAGKINVMQVRKVPTHFSFTLASIFNEIKAEPGESQTHKKKNSAHPKPDTTSKNMRISTENGKPVERIDEEVKFIKRFVLLHNKSKTKDQVLNFINALQRAITERRIRKTSPYSKEIMYVQSHLVKKYNSTGSSEIKFSHEKPILNRLMAVAGSEKIRLSIQYLKRYIGIHGKDITKEKAQALLNLISKAIEKGNIVKNDPYFSRIQTVVASLKKFVSLAKRGDTVAVHEAVLSGLNNVLEGCDCGMSGLSGIDTPTEDKAPQHTILNSLDIIKMKSNKLGFKDKWLTFIGNPSKGFTMMIFGKPKFGKSILASEFAGYLARNHGKVLYIAIEEGFEDTLKERLDDQDVAHENLDVSDYMPGNVSGYDFIFIDSVNRAGLNARDLDELERKNPGKSFIYVFQTTKDGDFKGAMEFKHNVDVIVEVPERGTATQYGRYNQGGEMSIF